MKQENDEILQHWFQDTPYANEDSQSAVAFNQAPHFSYSRERETGLNLPAMYWDTKPPMCDSLTEREKEPRDVPKGEESVLDTGKWSFARKDAEVEKSNEIPLAGEQTDGLNAKEVNTYDEGAVDSVDIANFPDTATADK